MTKEQIAELAALGIEVVILDHVDKVAIVHSTLAKVLDREYQLDWLEDKNGDHR